MRWLLLISALLVASAQASVTKVKVFRWVDENGVVTFSEYRPEKSTYVELEIEGDRVLKGKEQVSNLDNSKSSEESSAEAVKELNAQAKVYCEKARHNLKVLGSFKNVRVLDEDGNPKILNQNDVNQQRALAERQIDLFCED